MILVALRLVLGGGLLFGFWQVWRNAQVAPDTGDLTNAFWLCACVLLALANGALWAPWVGARVAGPVTGMLTDGTYADRRNHLLWLVRWLDDHRHRRWALAASLLEGIHHPEQPVAFVIGLKNARSGSWLEKVFAREVFRFDNIQHCLEAYGVLKRHGIDPRPHRNPEVNLALIAVERQVRPEAAVVKVAPAPEPPPLERDPRIRLFETDPRRDRGSGGTAP